MMHGRLLMHGDDSIFFKMGIRLFEELNAENPAKSFPQKYVSCDDRESPEKTIDVAGSMHS